MSNQIEVSDSLSNSEEQIERAAKTIGRSRDRRKVFDAIYHHKARIKTVTEIVQKTGLKRLRVLQEGRHFSRKGMVRQTKRDGETAYEKIDFFHAHKREILSYADNPKRLAKLPTKRKLGPVQLISIPSTGAKVKRVTVDEIASFCKVKKVKKGMTVLSSLSERSFKQGIQKILSEPGEFKDWPGEKSDLFSTRLRVNGKRLSAAFALKGPGERRKLVIAAMGKNGDQILRLFQEPADVFLVQHWREIDSSILDLMHRLAVAKSVTTGKLIWYGIIDGEDSRRLRLAYSTQFAQSGRQ